MPKDSNKKGDFLAECEEHFGTKNLYEVLGVEKTATDSEIKSAYRKKSLKVHPDRATEDRKEHAKQAFQTLTKVHCILTNENSRKLYDETGRVLTGDESDFASFSTYEEYEQYWRELFPKISTKQIDDFMKKYVGSDEEKKDLKNLYERFEGDMDKIYEYHYAYDEDRVVELLKEMVETEEVPAFDAFVDEPKAKKQKRLKRIEKEALAAEKEKKKQAKKKSQNGNANGGANNEEEDEEAGDLSALQLAIQKKNKGNFDNLLANLEAKYGNGSKRGGKNAKSNNKRARK